ncbi:MAG TPA: carbamoyltransferase HypF, partial [Acidimicrobiales bacterium]|nr:carbamoyltransferase HypF [Acidimicrobiales bacterium]
MIDTRERLALDVRGVVQGVGFRPFVYRLARELGLAGHVGNDSARVFIEVEGPGGAVYEFVARLQTDAPPLSRIETVATRPVPVVGETEFAIRPSEVRAGHTTLVSPDTAVCDECLAEMNDPSDRRYRHPFITCTNCGPRFTIIETLPYDRPNTTMSAFPMCPACRSEYEDICDRRHHAQPICCHDCGPTLVFESRSPAGDEAVERASGTEPALAAARRALSGGRILAVKGLGGFHLVCDAGSEAAVGELRRRKHRPDKPLAVMAADLETAHRLVHLDPGEVELLTSPARPIVLARRKPDAPVAPAVAPGDPFLGVMLPYTPLHHLLLGGDPVNRTEVPPVLVMTSGNRSGEPICHLDSEVVEKLGAMVDGYLTHDRPIHVPCDDSVVRVVAGRELPVRRSRGYCPMPVRLVHPVPPSLGVGGELKNTFCVAHGEHAWVSQHIGDMGDLETLRAFERSLGDFERMYRVEPRVVAVDAHPGYRTRRWADQSGSLRPVPVQHHHAHVAAVMAEHG